MNEYYSKLPKPVRIRRRDRSQVEGCKDKLRHDVLTERLRTPAHAPNRHRAVSPRVLRE